MFLSLSKFKTLKRTSIFWIIFLLVILFFAIGYQNKVMAASCADCSRCKGARVYGNIYDSNTGGRISGATVTVTTTATSGTQCPSTSSSVHGWCGPKSGSTTTNSSGYYNFARVDGLYCFVNCGWGYSAPWRLSVSHPNYSSNSTTFSPTNGSQTVVNLSLTPKSTPPPQITCWSCNTSNYTCSSHTYTGTYCPSGTYSSSFSCQSACQAPQSITCWSCNTSNYTCSSQSYTGTYCPSGTYSSSSSCQSACQAPQSITCWSCNTSNYTCSSQSYSGTYCPSGTYSSSSSCQNNCQQSTITCWSCNISNYTCYSHTYSGTYCPSGTYSSSSSCQNNCQQSTITCWSCNTSNYTCYSHTYSGNYCPSGTYSSSSSCRDACEESTIRCWSCNTNNGTCSSRTYSGYYCPSGTYSSSSSCRSACQPPPDSPVLNVSKTVRNIADNTTFQNSVSADPLERLEFKIKVSSTGSTRAKNVIVKDTLPWQITYQNNLKINGVSSAGNILTGLNLGTVYPGYSKIITFEAKVVSEDKFIYGITTLTNTAMAYSVNTEDTDTAKIVVSRKAVAGVATEVKTGIIGGLLDYFLFPLIIAFIMILVFKNYLVLLNEWFEKRKNGAIEYRANKSLKKVISRIKARERF